MPSLTPWALSLTVTWVRTTTGSINNAWPEPSNLPSWRGLRITRKPWLLDLPCLAERLRPRARRSQVSCLGWLEGKVAAATLSWTKLQHLGIGCCPSSLCSFSGRENQECYGLNRCRGLLVRSKIVPMPVPCLRLTTYCSRPTSIVRWINATVAWKR